MFRRSEPRSLVVYGAGSVAEPASWVGWQPAADSNRINDRIPADVRAIVVFFLFQNGLRWVEPDSLGLPTGSCEGGGSERPAPVARPTALTITEVDQQGPLLGLRATPSCKS